MARLGLCPLQCFTVLAFGITSSGEVLGLRGSQKWQNLLLICGLWEAQLWQSPM